MLDLLGLTLSDTVKTRFAPSPTGMLHPGSVRTALFAYLFARQHKGQAILRIEDTDRQRSEKRYEEALLEDLKWLGLTFDGADGEMIRQSERADVYDEYLGRLSDAGLTYESEDEDGRVATYFRPPERKGTFRDELRGDVPFSRVEDFVVRKSDGTPSYNFAAFCDDARMGITDVLRGEEHLSNSARQVLLYRALGEPEPHFRHLGVVLGTDGKKLSKRHGAATILELRQGGYLPEAVINYLALLGWNHPEGREYFSSIDDLSEQWDAKRLGASPSTFDPERMLSLNAQHIRATSAEHLKDALTPFLDAPLPQGRELVTVEALKEEMKILRDAPRILEGIRGEVDVRSLAGQLPGSSVGVFEETEHRLGELSVLNLEEARTFVKELRGWAKDEGMKTRDLLHPLRLALTGQNRGPEMAYIFAILGSEESRSRIASARRAVDDGLY